MKVLLVNGSPVHWAGAAGAMTSFLDRNMVFFLKCKEASLKAGVPLPEQEPVTFTNFIRT